MDFESIRGREERKERKKERRKEKWWNFLEDGNGISWEGRWRKVATGIEEEKYGRDGRR